MSLTSYQSKPFANRSLGASAVRLFRLRMAAIATSRLEVPQPSEPSTPIVPDAPVTPADPDPGTPADPEQPATVPGPDEPATPVVPEPSQPDPGSAALR